MKLKLRYFLLAGVFLALCVSGVAYIINAISDNIMIYQEIGSSNTSKFPGLDSLSPLILRYEQEIKSRLLSSLETSKVDLDLNYIIEKDRALTRGVLVMRYELCLSGSYAEFIKYLQYLERVQEVRISEVNLERAKSNISARIICSSIADE